MGLLKYILTAYTSKKIKNCYVQPVVLNFENIVEFRELEKYWYGKKKTNLSLFSFFKNIPGFSNTENGDDLVKLGQGFYFSDFYNNNFDFSNNLVLMGNEIVS